jgi:uncharacterized protein
MDHSFQNRVLGWCGALFVGVMGMLWPLTAEATGVYQMPLVSAGEATWVVDDANVLSRLNEGKLSSQFQDLAEATGTEVRLVTIHRLDYGKPQNPLPPTYLRNGSPPPKPKLIRFWWCWMMSPMA